MTIWSRGTRLGGSGRISPTGHYTGYVWVRQGLSHRVMGTTMGRLLHAALRPPLVMMSKLTGGLTMEGYLLERHLLIDTLLSDAIEEGSVAQVLEIGSGLSPRGFQLARRYPMLRFFEGELPWMARIKSDKVRSAHLGSDNLTIIALDLLASEGPTSLESIVEQHLDPTLPTAIIVEGVLNYFPAETIDQILSRFAKVLSIFPHGCCFGTLELQEEAARWLVIRLFLHLLGLVTGGQAACLCKNERGAQELFGRAGFAETRVHRPPPDPDIPQIACIFEAIAGPGHKGLR